MSIAKFLGAHPNVYISSIPNSSLWSSYKFFVKFWKVFLIKGKHKFEAWLVTCDSKNQRLDKDLAIAEDCNARHGLSRHLTLWTRIAQNVKKPSLTVNVINFRFFVIMYPLIYPYGSLAPKSHDALVELFRFPIYVERTRCILLHF